MSFICALKDGQPVDVTLLARGGETIARLAIGYDDATDDVISVVCALAPFPTGAEDGLELVFFITRASRFDDEDVTDYWDGHDTMALIKDPHDRHMTLNAVLVCIEALISTATPTIVALMTHQADLPDKALSKYGEICNLFSSKGYFAGRADSYHGRHIWMMSLR